MKVNNDIIKDDRVNDDRAATLLRPKSGLNCSTVLAIMAFDRWIVCYCAVNGHNLAKLSQFVHLRMGTPHSFCYSRGGYQVARCVPLQAVAAERPLLLINKRIMRDTMSDS